MSLKAKLEAVIYAAEEPVTLAQLSALFAADALEWKAQEEAASLDRSEDASGADPAEPPLNREFAYRDPDPSPWSPPPPAPGAAKALARPDPEPNPWQPDPHAPPPPGPAGVPAPDPAVEPEPAPSVPEEDEPAPAEDGAADAEARRQTRLRDREARAIIRQLLDELIETYASDGRGIEIREIAGGYRMATKPECHDAVRSFVKSLKPALKLSLPALETLAVVAYKQPVTAPEVNEIRGVDSSGVFGSLLARKLIATAGRKQVIGRPILYKTTREFLLRFGLKDVAELPSMEEFEKLAAIELDEPEPEPAAGRAPNPAAGPEFDEAASEDLEDAPAQNAEPQPETPEPNETAETAASNETDNPAVAAPAAPPPTEPAETETFPHGEEDQEVR